ncbi:KEOPS complex N(6)-L-threonylcarbamoyladenine synthase Kae1 [Desulfurococcus mucosus]|uniref:tRNA N6-adenosine threonylcarbamoyltransferase n=1 Tax=Desulfurococcus mucosus (strain ATCC 35584 / DSM 2162 / JCM 9187 / O7/1) TaxID=765177 RepID=E8R7G1_DESM0|nr:KEOPS complex N(6)-L-threonylcarbamoyladenine synthase Kae1 [Desulfurococcus mucosus]ADV65626.1 metalloendopeptidase, glycoprotease family [Desulfurococcus mucosus DSM 2162]
MPGIPIPFKLPVATGGGRLRILGVESTSHTIGIGVVEYFDGSVEVLANVNSQYKPEKGGLHPREASLHHVKAAPQLLREALGKAGVSVRELNAIAVSIGPGIGPCLRVGVTLARFLSKYYGIPFVPVNHAVAHIEIGKLYSGFNDPVIVYVSGGNTMVVVQKDKRFRVMGETLDIPLGNLFDTFAREIGIAPPYVTEGRHAVDICADWNPDFQPLPYTVKGSDLSFSGLLTAALRLAREARGDKGILGRICNSLRETAFNMLIEVSERVLALTGKKQLLLVGGVASNRVLRGKMETLTSMYGVKYYGTPPDVAGDNGAMIAYTGLLLYLHNMVSEPSETRIRQRYRIDEELYPWL